MTDNVRFLPAAGADREGTHISLTSGHACRVYAIGPDGNKGTWIPMMFRKEAIGAGCGIVGVDERKDPAPTENKQDLIIKAMTELLEKGNKNTLQGDGRPKLASVKTLAGFNVAKGEYDAAWEALEASLDEDDGEGDEGGAAGDATGDGQGQDEA